MTSKEEQPSSIHDERATAKGIIGTAQLYQEDSLNGVTTRLYLPRLTVDPNDPLTWGALRKALAFTSTCMFVFLSNYITTTVSPIFVALMEHFEIGADKASYLVTFNILFLGLGNIFWIPLSRKIGKRPVLILCSLIFFVSSIWATVAQSFGSLFGARIIQGFAASASEALGLSVVADLFFLHDRGAMVGIYSFMISGGSALGGIFAGLVANANPNWRWVFGMNTVLTGVLFIFTVLFQAETNFERPYEYEHGEGLEYSEVLAIKSQVSFSWAKSLSVTGSYDRNASLWRLGTRPFLMLRYPAVIWCIAMYGVTLGFFVLNQTADSSAFPELYGYSELAVGNINVANLIGAAIGTIVGGPLSDYAVAVIAKHRRGQYRPEYRLWCLVPVVIFGPVGILLWGAGLGEHLDPMVAIAGSGIMYGVLVAVPAIGMTYVVDCYRPVAGETMTILTACKNTLAFGISFAVIPWVKRDGYLKVGGLCTLIEGVVFLTTIPMYYYGERLRTRI